MIDFGEGFNIDDYTTAHLLVANSDLLEKDATFTNIQGETPLSTNDPFRSNMRAYWGHYPNYKDSGNDSLQYDRDRRAHKAAHGNLGNNYLWNQVGLKVDQNIDQSPHYYGTHSLPPAINSPFGIKLRNLCSLHVINPDTSGYGDNIWEGEDGLFTLGLLLSMFLHPESKTAADANGNSGYKYVLTTSTGQEFDEIWIQFTKEIWKHKYIGIPKGSSAETQLFPAVLKRAAVQILRNIQTKTYSDMSFNLPLPTTKQVSALNNGFKNSPQAPFGGGSLSGIGIGGGYVDIKPVYNYMIKPYEAALNTRLDLSEHVLPNIYVINSLAQDKKINELLQFADVFGRVQGSSIKGILSNNSSTNVNQDGEAENENFSHDAQAANNPGYPKEKTPRYFETFARELTNISTEEAAQAKRKFEHICFSTKSLELLKHANETKTAFPMYVDISFDAGMPGEFCHLLNSSNNSMHLLKTMLLSMFADVPVTINGTQQYTGIAASHHGLFLKPSIVPGAPGNLALNFIFTIASLAELPPAIAGEAIAKIATNERALKSFDVVKWWEEIMMKPNTEGFPSYTINNLINSVFKDGGHGVFFGEEEVEEVDPINDFLKQLSAIIFAGKFKNMTKKFIREFKDIIQGKKAHSETVFYRIEKRLGTGGPVLQNIWLPNLPGHDVLQYIDTQVKYGGVYEYNIFAYQIVFGSRYSYNFGYSSDPDTRAIELESYGIPSTTSFPAIVLNKDFDPAMSEGENFYVFSRPNNPDETTLFDVNLEPRVHIVEVPLYSNTINMVDAPPLSPNVDFTPYINVSDRLKIDLNNSSGDVDLIPIPIEEEDELQFTSVRQAQKRALQKSDGSFLEPNIRFKGDDFASQFEIYRLNKRPKNYKDFTGALRTTLSIDMTTSYVEKIVPNKKYYYMFRTIDSHGKKSNPSEVHEIEMTDDGGLILLNKKVIILGEEIDPTKILYKTMKKHILIRPASLQLMIKEEEAAQKESAHDLVKSPELGILEDSIFDNQNNKFKIRFTSRSTGKKIDLNINFDLKHRRLEK